MTASEPLDLNLIQLFVSIVDAGTLSEAAIRQRITRSHVSRGLQKLERALGAQLIRRTTRRLELTHEGTLLYEHGVRIARELESARHALHKVGSEPAGHVRVSIPTGLGELDLRPLLIRFAKQHPALNLRVLFSNRVSDLISSEIDVALRVITDPPQDYVAREICDVQWHLCATPEYLRKAGTLAHPRDLVRVSFLCPPGNKQYFSLALRHKTQTHTIKLVPHMQSEYFPFLAESARAGLGVALLPAYVVREDIARRRLRIVLPQYQVAGPGCKLYILTTPNPYPSSGVRAVVDFLRAELGSLIGA